MEVSAYRNRIIYDVIFYRRWAEHEIPVEGVNVEVIADD